MSTKVRQGSFEGGPYGGANEIAGGSGEPILALEAVEVGDGLPF
ncbi:hypothetical protein ABIF26_006987 [Bradyrhizobium elkanii]